MNIQLIDIASHSESNNAFPGLKLCSVQTLPAVQSQYSRWACLEASQETTPPYKQMQAACFMAFTGNPLQQNKYSTPKDSE